MYLWCVTRLFVTSYPWWSAVWERDRETKNKTKQMKKKKTQGGRKKSTQKQITHPYRKITKSTNTESKRVERGGEVGDLAISVTSGRGFLSSFSLKVRPFYLYSTVMCGISFEGGEYEPLFFLAAVRLAQQAQCTEMSAVYRLYLFNKLYLLLINIHSFLIEIGNLIVSDEKTCFIT